MFRSPNEALPSISLFPIPPTKSILQIKAHIALLIHLYHTPTCGPHYHPPSFRDKINDIHGIIHYLSEPYPDACACANFCVRAPSRGCRRSDRERDLTSERRCGGCVGEEYVSDLVYMDTRKPLTTGAPSQLCTVVITNK
jgi:hypothetical protein